MTNRYKEIAMSNNTAAAFFVLLGRRERNRASLNIGRLKSDLRAFLNGPLSVQELMETLKALERTGAGKIQYGIRGAAKYFFWKVPMLGVARAAGLTDQQSDTQRIKVPAQHSMGVGALPRIVQGRRTESAVRLENAAKDSGMKSHIVFVFPNGEIKKMDFSTEIPDSTLTDIAKLFIKVPSNEALAKTEHDLEKEKNVRSANSNVPGLRNNQ